jgi:hypothetical protein
VWKEIDVETSHNVPVSNTFIAVAEQFRLAPQHVGKSSRIQLKKEHFGKVQEICVPFFFDL